jgi:hypothetical protein
MKKLKYQIIIAVALVMAVISCQKKSIDRFTPSRMFTPTGLTVAGGDTAVTITWPASLFSAGSGVSYTVEISADTTFQAAPALTFITDTTRAFVTDDSLQDRVGYFVRVKANATKTATESAWIESASRFTLVGVQIFHSIQSSDILDDEAILNWTPTPGITKIVVTGPNGETFEFVLAPEELNAGQKLVTGLTGGTPYKAEIFADTRSKGLLNFTTKSAVSGDNVIDLRNITDRPGVLTDTLPQIPDGAIILLKRGLTYTVPDAYTFDKSVSIRSGLGFDAPATLLLSNNFDATGDIDSLLFSDLNIATDGSANYFMNVGHVTTIGQLSVINCTTSGVYNNSFIRLKTGDADIRNLLIDNCIIDSFGIGAKYAVLYANASSTARIDNITVQNSTFSSFYYFIRQDGITGTSIKINNCTFNDMINQGGYFINYSGTFPSVFNINNSIFGRTLDATNANGIKAAGNAVLSNCYMVSDCVFSANPITGATSYAGAAADLFASPDNGNFSFKDNSFAGKSTTGDPRWR